MCISNFVGQDIQFITTSGSTSYIPKITIVNCQLNGNIYIDTLFSFIGCRFASDTYIVITSTLKELNSQLTSVYEKNKRNQIQFYQCEFSEIYDLIIQNTRAQIFLEECNFVDTYLYIVIGSKTTGLEINAEMSLKFINCSCHNAIIRIVPWLQNSFGFILFYQSMFDRSHIHQYPTGGYVGYHFENCTFLNIESQGISVDHAIYMKISNCYFEIAIENEDCYQDGCFISAKGRYVELGNEEQVFKLFNLSCVRPGDYFWGNCLKIDIEDSVFIGTPAVGRYMLAFVYYMLSLKNCIFFNHERDQHFIGTGVVYSANSNTVISQTIFNFTQTINRNAFAVLTARFHTNLSFNNFEILCPQGLKVAINAQTNLDRVHRSYLCNKACKVGQHALTAGYLVTSGTSFHGINDNVSNPLCYPCPTGARCDNYIQSLPNYWGYKNDSDLISMIRCPEGYCCQNKSYCEGVSSCAQGRKGILCGTCRPNLTESLVSSRCIEANECYPKVIILLYFLAALCYALVALTVNTLKKGLLGCITNVNRYLKRKLRKGYNSDHDNKDGTKEENAP